MKRIVLGAKPNTIREVALSEGVMTEAQLAEAFTTDNLLVIRK